MARQVGPGGRLPSFSMLRDRLEVSTSTLYQAVEELERQGVIVRHQGRGLFASPHLHHKTIGFLLGIDPNSAVQSPYYRMLHQELALLTKARSWGLEVYVDLPYGDKRQQIRRRLHRDVETGQVDGLLTPAARDLNQLQWLLDREFPCVYMGRKGDPGCHFEFDYPGLVRQAIMVLKRAGCERIGFIDHADRDNIQRHGNPCLDAFHEELGRHQLQAVPVHCKQFKRSAPAWSELMSPTFEELGYQAILDIWSGSANANAAPPDGLVITDDMLTRGAIAGLHRLGLYPGRDVRIVTQASAGSPVLAPYAADLFRIELDVKECAAAMLGLLEQRMKPNAPRQCHQLLSPGPLRIGEHLSTFNGGLE